ncbi:branched-chain amino acid ABC transporter substrate-binding protein [Hippea jasoniae]|uniref:branched-chain amino acid ABC transporter substrate-binding protein n=1 Tax=Hippea jasoniae TaxID=944479 RepID=UPI000551242B|nr:branched-chain amino acid ABC transporter substrate-binding protein [Hippea jasoniae]
MRPKFFGGLVALLVALMFAVSSFAAGVIKIGVQAPITGKFASEGQSIDKAVRLIVKQVNAKGGVLGKKLEVVTCDDEGKAVKAAICARKLVDAGVIAVIGSYTSTCAEAAEPIYYRAGVLQTSDGTSDTLVKHGYWTFFRNSSPNSAEAKFTAEFFMKKQHYKRIALISDYSTFSTNLTNAVRDNLKKMGGNVVYYGKITSGAQNFTPILTKIKSYNPDVIYFGGYYTDGGLIRAQMVQLGIKADFVGGDSNDNPEFLKLAGKAAVGAYLINVPLPDMLPYPAAKKFLKAYKETYHENPASIWTLFNVDGLRVILYAIQQTKSLDTKKIADYLHNDLKNFPGITGPISFAKNGERVGSAYMAYRIGPDLKYHIVYKEK